MIKIRLSFRWILQCPDISRHLENRLRQTGCSGVFGVIKLNLTENSIKRKIGIFRRKNTMCNKNLKTLKNNYLCRMKFLWIPLKSNGRHPPQTENIFFLV